jgi:hypothetical protein
MTTRVVLRTICDLRRMNRPSMAGTILNQAHQ